MTSSSTSITVAAGESGQSATEERAVMKVEVVLDIACVWSYLGYTCFARAVERHRDGGDEVDVVFRPFQVDPDANPRGEPLRDVLRRNFGADVETKNPVRSARGTRWTANELRRCRAPRHIRGAPADRPGQYVIGVPLALAT